MKTTRYLAMIFAIMIISVSCATAKPKKEPTFTDKVDSALCSVNPWCSDDKK